MAVPTRPTSGTPIETAWGQVAHDAAVAQDMQAGVATVAFAASAVSALVTVTFPRPFASAPVVLVAGFEGSSGSNINVGIRAISTTQFQVQAREVRETAISTNLLAQWFAYGPRA